MAVEKGLYGSNLNNNKNGELWNAPTQTVVRPTTVVMAELAALNIIGSFAVVIDMTDAPAGKNMYFFNSSLASSATLSAILSGSPVLIGGAASIEIPITGGCDPICLYWSGTTLTVNS
jgi:hypothetical protein